MSRRRLLVVAVACAVVVVVMWMRRAPDGRPSVQGQPEASGSAATTAGRRTPRPPRMRAPSQVRLVEVEVVPSGDALGDLTGTVLSRGDGRPIAGAQLFFEAPDDGNLRQVSTKDDGTYRYRPTAAGWHRLVAAEAAGFVAYGEDDAPLVFHARQGQGVAAGPITLRPRVEVAVFVRGPEGAIAGAEVVVLASDGEAARTNEEGRVTLALDDGAIVEARAEGFRTGRAAYGLTAQVTQRLTLTLEPVGADGADADEAVERLVGTVRDSRGDPIEGARIQAYWLAPPDTPERLLPRHQTLTDDDGTFELTGLEPGNYAVRARAEGFAEAATRSAVPGAEVTLTLVAGLSIVGKVTDQDGEPLPSFTVVVTQALHALASRTVAVEQALDPKGAYEVPHLAPGEYVVFAVGPGSARSEGTKVTLASEDARVDFALAAAGTLTGTVTDRESGAPLEGAKISIEGNLAGDLQLAGTAFSDAKGRFALRDLPATPTSVVVAAEGHHPRILSGILIPAGETRDVAVDLAPLADEEEPKIELAGIGAVLSGTEEGLAIRRVIEGGGAAEVGLGPGDLIVTIEGAKATELGFGGCIERLRGPEGSTVTVTVLRPGAEEPVPVVIPRRRIKA